MHNLDRIQWFQQMNRDNANNPKLCAYVPGESATSRIESRFLSLEDIYFLEDTNQHSWQKQACEELREFLQQKKLGFVVKDISHQREGCFQFYFKNPDGCVSLTEHKGMRRVYMKPYWKAPQRRRKEFLERNDIIKSLEQWVQKKIQSTLDRLIEDLKLD